MKKGTLLWLGLVLLPGFAQAAGAPPALGPDASGGTQGSANGIQSLISSLSSNILNLLTLIAGILAVGFLIWAGIQYILAGGSPEKAKTARTSIINAMIGIVVITATYGIIRFAITIGNTINTYVH